MSLQNLFRNNAHRICAVCKQLHSCSQSANPLGNHTNAAKRASASLQSANYVKPGLSTW